MFHSCPTPKALSPHRYSHHLGKLIVTLGPTIRHLRIYLVTYFTVYLKTSRKITMKDLYKSLSEHVDELLGYYELGARNFRRVTLSQARLSNVGLVNADFSNSNFASAEFENVDLSQAVFRGSDLSNTKILSSNLSQADLQEVDLENANICDANLQDANLVRANLSEASLIDSNLQGVDLGQAHLKGANLADTNLKKANLTLANLSLANLVGADLNRANLDRTILKDAIYSETTRFPEEFDPVQAGMKIVDPATTKACLQLLERYRLGERNFRRIMLTEACLGKVDLSGSDFTGADLTRADLSYANLQGAIFVGAELGQATAEGADLTGVDLSRANLDRIQFKQSCLASANLDRATFIGANLAKTNLSGTSLEQASLMGGNLSNANLSNAKLRYANLTEVNLTGANLSGADLSTATLNGTVLKDAHQNKNTRWPEGFEPASVGVRSSDRSIKETDELPSLSSSELPAPTQKPTPSLSSGKTISFSAKPVETDDFPQRSFTLKPAVYLAFVLLSVATLGGSGYFIHTLLQQTSTVSDETEPRISSTDISTEESDTESMPIENIFGDRPSDERFQRAADRYRNGQLDEAIALLKLIPENNQDFNLAQDTVSVWQLESDRRFIELARQELDNQNWQAAVEATELIVNDAWKAQALLLADEAHYRLALEALDRGNLEKAKLTANSISDEVRQKEILTAIGMQPTVENPPETPSIADNPLELSTSLLDESKIPEIAQLEALLRSDDPDPEVESNSEDNSTAESKSNPPHVAPNTVSIGEKGRMIWPDGLAMLSEPRGAYIGGIPFNETVTILELSGDGRWQRVRRDRNGQEGWVKAGNIATVDSIAASNPAITDVKQQGSSTEAQSALSNSSAVVPETVSNGVKGRMNWPDGLAMRSEPGGAYIGGIPFNETVTILELSGDGRWQRVRRDRNGLEGWVKTGNIVTIQ
ncbi:MAG: pentapeptide repeat-containing protein [Synechococcus sp.]